MYSFQKIFTLIFILLISLQAITQTGREMEVKATFYSKKFDGRKTYSGEIFNSNKYTAAHRSIPLQSLVKVINVKNNRCIIVKINDRFYKKNFIDLSYIAAEKLDIIKSGIAKVKIQLLDTNYFREYISQSQNEESSATIFSDTSQYTEKSDTLKY